MISPLVKIILFAASLNCCVLTKDFDVNKVFYDQDGKISDEKSTGGVNSIFTYTPGLRVRLSKGLVDLVRDNLLEYGQSFLNTEY
jgi:hypothetical protein